MDKILISVIGISAVIAVPLSSLATGLKFGSAHLKDLRDFRSVLLRYSLAMFILIPAYASLLLIADKDRSSLWGGIFLMSISPVMPAIIGGGGQEDRSSHLRLAWFVFAMYLSLIFIPLLIVIVRNILGIDFDIAFMQIFTKLLTFFIIPLFAGFLINKFFPGAVSFITKYVSLLSKIAMIVLVVAILIVAVPMAIMMGIESILLLIGFLLVTFLTGFILGYPERGSGNILASSLLMRLPAPAIVIAQINGTVKQHLPVIILYVLFGVLILTIFSRLFGKKNDSVSPQ